MEEMRRGGGSRHGNPEEAAKVDGFRDSAMPKRWALIDANSRAKTGAMVVNGRKTKAIIAMEKDREKAGEGLQRKESSQGSAIGVRNPYAEEQLTRRRRIGYRGAAFDLFDARQAYRVRCPVSRFSSFCGKRPGGLLRASSIGGRFRGRAWRARSREQGSFVVFAGDGPSELRFGEIGSFRLEFWRRRSSAGSWAGPVELPHGSAIGVRNPDAEEQLTHGQGKGRNQVHEVAAETGDSDMGAIHLSPIDAATNELHGWYNEDPWQGVFAPHRAEEPSGKERWRPIAQ